MKKVRVNYDISSDIIACPDYMVHNFDDYVGGIYKWIREDPEAKEYRLGSGKNMGYYIDSDVIVQYLNHHVIKEEDEEVYILKRDVSADEQGDCSIDF